MSVVSQVILNADDELRYPTSGELKGIENFLKTGNQRMRIAQTLADNEKKIVDQASSRSGKFAQTSSPKVVTPTVKSSAPFVCATMAGIYA